MSAAAAGSAAPLDEQTERRLVEAAEGAMREAYAPYSRFRVGAALLCDDGTPDGRLVTGCNVENASYPASICAERSAVAAAVSMGLRRFRAVAIVTEAEAPSPPCGICRQVLVEFAAGMPVTSATTGGAVERWTMDVLLPAPFVPDSLARG